MGVVLTYMNVYHINNYKNVLTTPNLSGIDSSSYGVLNQIKLQKIAVAIA